MVICTGCPTISVKSNTPPFLRHMLTHQEFYVVNGHKCGFDIFFKNFEILFFCHGQVQVQAQPGFQLIPVCSKFKFKFSVGIQLFGRKNTSHGKSDLKNQFFRSGLPCEVVFSSKN